MKLGLLVVLAVAVGVSVLSEARVVSKCELKEKLREAIVLPRRLTRIKERILDIVVCEVERRSQLETDLVRMIGGHSTTAAASTTEATTEPTFETTSEPTFETTSGPTFETTSEPTFETTSEPTFETTSEPTFETTSEPTFETTSEPTFETTSEPTTETMTESTTAQITRGLRQKRDVDSASSESDSSVSSSSIEDLLEDEESEESDEDQDYEMSDETSDEQDSDSSDEEDEESSARSKRSFHWRRSSKRRSSKRRSKGFYGLFQLGDGYFCDSGLTKTRNKCRTDCLAFTDDDITDDIKCFVKTRAWLFVLKTSTARCRRAPPPSSCS